MGHYRFTSESVTEGHPDKICDQISDAVLDAILEQDPQARVACECCTTTGMVLVMGEISTSCYVDIPAIVRKAGLGLKGVIHAHGDVAALLVDAGDDGAGVAVEAVLRTVVADIADGLSHDGGNVHVALGGDLAHHQHHAGGGAALAGHAGHGILRKDGVQHSVADLVADLIGMTLGH